MNKTFRPQRYTWLLSAITILIVVVILWMPFGLKRTDFQEGWVMRDGTEKEGWMVFGSGRIMAPLPWEVATFLTPDSFIGEQLLMVFFFWAKAFILYLILRLLKIANHAIALLIGILFIIYPADTGLLTLRAFGHHSGVFFFLLSVLFLILSCTSANKANILLMIVSHTISSFTSEAGSMLAFFAPLLIFLNPSSPKPRKFTVLALWYSILLYSFISYFLASEYQTVRFDIGYSSNTFLVDVFTGNLRAFWLAFVLSWWNVLGSLHISWPYFPYAIVMALAAGIGIWRTSRVPCIEEENISTNKSKYFVVLISGIIIFTLGFFPFSVTDLRNATWRVFFYAAMGPAIFWGEFIYLIHLGIKKYTHIFLPIVSVVAVFLTAVNALNQHASLYFDSLNQQRVLESVIEQAPYVKPGTVVVLISDKVGSRAFPNDQVFSHALKWIYQIDDITGRTCFKNSDVCNFNDDGLDYQTPIPHLNHLNGFFDYENLLVFQKDVKKGAYFLDNPGIISHYSTTKYSPYERISGYLPFPTRPQKAFYSSVGPDPVRVSPKGWLGVDLNLNLNDRKVCDISSDKQCSLHLQGDQLATASFHQEIFFSGSAGQTVAISFLVKAKRLGDGVSWPQATLVFVNTEGTRTTFRQTLDKLTEDWQYIERKAEAAKPYKSVIVSFESGYGSWGIWIDSIKIFVDNKLLPVLNSSFED